MRKTKLFTLVALSALMAACSQDDFVTPAGDAKVDLANRPVLGDVTIDLGDANTRMAFNGSFNWKWEDGDEVGAAIVDAPKAGTIDGYVGATSAAWTYAEYVQGVKKTIDGKDYLFTETKVSNTPDAAYNTAEAWYELNAQNYISSNYPYVLKDNKFSSQANLVEGNYLFYAPYNQAHLTREPLMVVTPMIQDCSDEVMKSTKYKTQPAKVSSTSLSNFYKGTTEKFEKAIVAVGHKFLAAPADRTQPIEATAQMKDLFAYPMFTITNNYNGYRFDATTSGTRVSNQAIVLDSIQIYTTALGKEIQYKTAIDATKAKAALTGEDWTAAGKYTSDNSNTASLFAASSAYNKTNYFAATDGTTDTELTFSNGANIIRYQQQHITCDLGGKELAPSDTYHFHAILPAEDYAHALYAKVFVKIDGKRYVIYNGTDIGRSATVNTAIAVSDWNFRDEVNGDQNASFVRGEHYPRPELQEDGNGTKNFAGTMLTINLVGGNNQAAFALKDKANDYGFTDNNDLVTYIKNELQRGVNMIEDNANLTGVAREAWKTATGSAAGHFVFAANNTCIINADLVKELKNGLFVDASRGGSIQLDTNLPIAGDVKITNFGGSDGTYTEYTIETLDKTASYVFKLKDTSVGTDGTALVKGINKLTATSTLAMAKDNANAVVILNGGTTTLTNVTGINGIYVNGSATLMVNTACSALVVLDGGTITIGQNGSLTNANNDLKSGNVINTNLKQVAGTVAEGVTISASAAGFPTSAILANTKINEYTVTSDQVVTVEQQQIDMFANLSNVTIKLSAATEVRSANNVTLNNITLFEATASAVWNKAAANQVYITYPQNGNISNITEGADVTFVQEAGTNE